MYIMGSLISATLVSVTLFDCIVSIQLIFESYDSLEVALELIYGR